jgi:hypothetical protein
MNDTAVHALARRAGIAVEWRDYANKQHRVPTDNLRRIVAALQLPCDTAQTWRTAAANWRRLACHR